jgi:hypothetical protein
MRGLVFVVLLAAGLLGSFFSCGKIVWVAMSYQKHLEIGPRTRTEEELRRKSADDLVRAILAWQDLRRMDSEFARRTGQEMHEMLGLAGISWVVTALGAGGILWDGRRRKSKSPKGARADLDPVGANTLTEVDQKHPGQV